MRLRAAAGDLSEILDFDSSDDIPEVDSNFWDGFPYPAMPTMKSLGDPIDMRVPAMTTIET